MHKPDVIIVGAGVIGSSIAYELSKRGASVCIVDQGEAVKKASSAAAGMLGAQAEIEGESPLYSFAQSSKARFPALQKELQEKTGIDIELVQKGMIKLAWTEEEKQILKRRISLIGDDQKGSWLDPDEINKREPLVSTASLGGMWIPDDGHVNPFALSTAFIHGAITHGAQLLEYTHVESFIVENNQLSGVKTSEGSIYADEVVVTGGAWSARLLKEAGLDLNAYPVKGECFSVTSLRPFLQTTLFTEGCYIVPKKAGRLLIGATETPHSFSEKVQMKGISRLMERAMELLPALEETSFEKTWAGIRPQTEDGLPFMDAHPGYSNLWIATGHYRNGILLSAETGVFMADLIEGKPISEEWKTAFGLHRNFYQGSEMI
ncbi:glycine oxidase ThiO [Jeotgalibacillus proteolyticus]|uniref:glycine oxidase n=1 Tax=Jeotgalibacillus proteolyticus TaxID=2082395 RepID=A0A2S5GDK2_9BACL|nr:glycine oxidase ThiO [Jeotgalibacillus proteolyticus]PPA70973.1 glycine oxidase ThiO [Jeotgalibacillus proteolyticus]